MSDLDDHCLLADFARNGTEFAFSTLVTRHVNLVYSTALRVVGNPHHAEEVSQAVFLILAAKAGKLSPHTVLSGWLYQTTRLTAANFLRGEIRRQHREQAAYMRSTLNESDAPDWDEIAPLLDEAMGSLRETERNALILRFFENKTAAEVASELQTTEAAAHKRVSRAVEKLRKIFNKRGVLVPTALLTTTISAHSVQNAPGALATAISTVAVKSSTAATSSLPLVKGTLKTLAWTKMKTAVAMGLGMVLAAGTLTVVVDQLHERQDETEIQVLQIIRTNRWNSRASDAFGKLIVIGPKALPTLSKLMDWRETAFQRDREKFLSSLPAAVRPQFESLEILRQMHQNAVQITCELGPAATRPLTTALSRALAESDWHITTYALRALRWSMPESPVAVTAATNWLADPTRQHLFGTVEGFSVWTNFPQTIPLLVECLRNPHLAHEASAALAAFQTNAPQSVPALVEVAGSGVAGPPLQLNFRVTYPYPGQPFSYNRCSALDALAQMHNSSPEVLAVINQSLADANEDVRFAALRALVTLQQPSPERLLEVLNTFSPRRSLKFQKIIQWAGNLGTNGYPSLPWLGQFVSKENVITLSEQVDPNLGDFIIEPDSFQISSLVAFCRNRPEYVRQYLPDLIAELGKEWEPVEFLLDSKDFAPDITAALEPLLNGTNQLAPSIAAYIILRFDPRHTRALAALRHSVANGELNLRIIAAQWLWLCTGETNEVIPLCIEGLNPLHTDAGQTAVVTLNEMGPSAWAAIPALRAALWHNDRAVREQAGKALRKIAPAELPDIE